MPAGSRSPSPEATAAGFLLQAAELEATAAGFLLQAAELEVSKQGTSSSHLEAPASRTSTGRMRTPSPTASLPLPPAGTLPEAGTPPEAQATTGLALPIPAAGASSPGGLGGGSPSMSPGGSPAIFSAGGGSPTFPSSAAAAAAPQGAILGSQPMAAFSPTAFGQGQAAPPPLVVAGESSSPASLLMGPPSAGPYPEIHSAALLQKSGGGGAGPTPSFSSGHGPFPDISSAALAAKTSGSKISSDKIAATVEPSQVSPYSPIRAEALLEAYQLQEGSSPSKRRSPSPQRLPVQMAAKMDLDTSFVASTVAPTSPRPGTPLRGGTAGRLDFSPASAASGFSPDGSIGLEAAGGGGGGGGYSEDDELSKALNQTRMMQHSGRMEKYLRDDSPQRSPSPERGFNFSMTSASGAASPQPLRQAVMPFSAAPAYQPAQRADPAPLSPKMQTKEVNRPPGAFHVQAAQPPKPTRRRPSVLEKQNEEEVAWYSDIKERLAKTDTALDGYRVCVERALHATLDAKASLAPPPPNPAMSFRGGNQCCPTPSEAALQAARQKLMSQVEPLVAEAGRVEERGEALSRRKQHLQRRLKASKAVLAANAECEALRLAPQINMEKLGLEGARKVLNSMVAVLLPHLPELQAIPAHERSPSEATALQVLLTAIGQA